MKFHQQRYFLSAVLPITVDIIFDKCIDVIIDVHILLIFQGIYTLEHPSQLIKFEAYRKHNLCSFLCRIPLAITSYAA